MGCSFRPHHTSHERPIIGERSSIVTQRHERLIRSMSREIMVVPGVMVIGIHLPVNRVHNCQVMRLLRQQRQMFAKRDTWRRRLNRLERPSIFDRGLGFQVPRIQVRGTSAQEQQDGGLCTCRRRRWGRPHGCVATGGKSHARETGCRHLQEISSRQKMTRRSLVRCIHSFSAAMAGTRKTPFYQPAPPGGRRTPAGGTQATCLWTTGRCYTKVHITPGRESTPCVIRTATPTIISRWPDGNFSNWEA